MTKAIVSSKFLYGVLNGLLEMEQHEFLFVPGAKSLFVDGVEIGCECSSPARHLVESSSVKRLLKVLRVLQEQPITIAIDSANWLYIKEAIL